ncbi:RsmF rRNA methyltransferase first C-terminal domain-containing protein [Paenibacillus athensensis]|uniref:RNA methyltransferase n=1 Tax=Paenibacillus athensensis TaxID=1967502 RepID=A0A4Y8QB03_9BACL|nr:RsmB/NOP family class I SAM-dependent RNA methyltransferase [Paenibacillus athensensis]MCD1259114.1 RsmF rRNA methyltransferase first C-terminal domain-containing protein [Paenibacillus athensensis]
MNRPLPPEFIQQMHGLLGAEEAALLAASYDNPRVQGLRFNPLKLSPASTAAERLTRSLELTPVPWCPTGYYYEDSVRPGKHPWHAAGLYYMQEPSAMSAVELLAPQPGDIVLDLAAAPGGKSTHIAGKLQGEGLLIANEIHPARAKILSENIERLGVANAIVVSSAPDRLAQRFPQFFDKIMLDAPCSGEGMFRKDPDAIAEWSPAHVVMCAKRQLDIAPEAVAMLKPGGLLAYSTCTFNREENEGVVEQLIAASGGALELVRVERIWPHRQRGEGHFVALLRKRGGADAGGPADAAGVAGEPGPRPRGKRGGGTPPPDKAAAEGLALFEAFRRDALPAYRPAGEPLLFGEQLYLLPPAAAALGLGGRGLDGLRVLRPGLHLGELKKRRFEPSHALALALNDAACAGALAFDVAADSPLALAYLRGEALPTARDSSGWALLRVDGFPLGWGKESGGQLKNHYPKGLRWPL